MTVDFPRGIARHAVIGRLNITMMIDRVIKRAQPRGCDSDSLHVHAPCIRVRRTCLAHRRQNKPSVFTESEKINPLCCTIPPDPLFSSNRRRCFCQIIRVGMRTRARERDLEIVNNRD